MRNAAGLEEGGCIVNVGPPLSCNPPNIGLAFTTLVVPVNPHAAPLSSVRLRPTLEMRGPVQLPPELAATIVAPNVTVPVPDITFVIPPPLLPPLLAVLPEMVLAVTVREPLLPP